MFPDDLLSERDQSCSLISREDGKAVVQTARGESIWMLQEGQGIQDEHEEEYEDPELASICTTGRSVMMEDSLWACIYQCDSYSYFCLLFNLQ